MRTLRVVVSFMFLCHRTVDSGAGRRGRGGRGARAGGGGPGAARRGAGGVTMGLVELLGDINEDGLRAAG